MWELSRMAWLLPLVRGNAQEPWQLLMFALLGPTRSFVRDTVRALSPQTLPLTDELGSALVARSFLCASYVWATVCRAFSRRNARNWLPPGGRRKKTHAALKKGIYVTFTAVTTKFTLSKKQKWKRVPVCRVCGADKLMNTAEQNDKITKSNQIKFNIVAHLYMSKVTG